MIGIISYVRQIHDFAIHKHRTEVVLSQKYRTPKFMMRIELVLFTKTVV